MCMVYIFVLGGGGWSGLFVLFFFRPLSTLRGAGDKREMDGKTRCLGVPLGGQCVVLEPTSFLRMRVSGLSKDGVICSGISLGPPWVRGDTAPHSGRDMLWGRGDGGGGIQHSFSGHGRCFCVPWGKCRLRVGSPHELASYVFWGAFFFTGIRGEWAAIRLSGGVLRGFSHLAADNTPHHHRSQRWRGPTPPWWL